MSAIEYETLRTPVGRLVYGSVYEAKTTDYDGEPLVYKKGAKIGQPMHRFEFGVAVQKQGEQHWNQTEWGRKIWDIGHRDFPNGQTQQPSFAWKITDGDCQIPNKKQNKPCDKEGYPGHWVLNFSCMAEFAPSLCNASDPKNIKHITQPDFINCGDFVEIAFSSRGNGDLGSPGVYLNPLGVAWRAYGERISFSFKIDVTTIGFGQAALPAGASSVPLSSNAAPSATTIPVAPIVQPVLPHYAILTPPAPVPGLAPPAPIAPAVRQMVDPTGATYEQYIAAGWTDVQLIQQGKMLA